MQPKFNKTVLISSAETGVAFASALALRRTWGNSVRIITADINEAHLVTCSLLSNKHIQVPLNQSQGFKKCLEGIILDEAIDTYIPVIDTEIYIGALLFSENRMNKGTAVQVIDPGVADICLDKYRTFKYLSENNILTPMCYLTNERINTRENLILKLRKGYASQFEQIHGDLDLSRLDPETYLIQDECARPEITVDVCYDMANGFFSYICRERIEVKSGVCTKARLFYDDETGMLAFTLAEKLKLSSFCFQLMRYKDKWAVTDINARLGAGTPVSVAAGLDFFSAMFAILWKGDPSVFFRKLQKEVFITRQYSDFVMNQ